MKQTILAAAAAAIALSLPAVALPHEEAHRQVRPPPPPAYAERREVAELRQLVARLDDAAARRARREVAWIEAELLRACEREIDEARAARAVAWQEVPGSRRDQRAAWSRPAHARLDELRDVRAGLASLRGRTDWRSIRLARDLGASLIRLAALDIRSDVPPPPWPWYADRGHGDGQDWDGRHGRD